MKRLKKAIHISEISFVHAFHTKTKIYTSTYQAKVAAGPGDMWNTEKAIFLHRLVKIQPFTNTVFIRLTALGAY